MGMDQACLIGGLCLLRAQERQTMYGAAPHPSQTFTQIQHTELLGAVRTEMVFSSMCSLSIPIFAVLTCSQICRLSI